MKLARCPNCHEYMGRNEHRDTSIFGIPVITCPMIQPGQFKIAGPKKNRVMLDRPLQFDATRFP